MLKDIAIIYLFVFLNTHFKCHFIGVVEDISETDTSKPGANKTKTISMARIVVVNIILFLIWRTQPLKCELEFHPAKVSVLIASDFTV